MQIEGLSKHQNLFIEESKLSGYAWTNYKQALQAIHRYEEDNELFELSEVELSDIVGECLSYYELATAGSYCDIIQVYLNWIKRNRIYKIPYDCTKVFTKIRNEMEENAKLLVLSRDELYSYAYDFVDKQQSIFLILLFEGIKGTSPMELLHIKKEDITNTRIQLIGRTIEVPEDVLPMAELGYNQIKSRGKVDYFKNEYLIQNAWKTDIEDRNKTGTVTNRLDRLKRIPGSPDLSIAILEYSGILYYLAVIEKIKSELVDEDYYKVLCRYRKDLSIKELNKVKRKYKTYKSSDKFPDNIEVTRMLKVYNDIMSVDSGVVGTGEINRELGKLGEAFMFNLLQKLYPAENDVVDLTLNKAGYDYLVNSTGDEYEVKSTGRIVDELTFYMTIGEIRKALEDGNKYKIAILSFYKQEVKNIYVIPNPMDALKTRDSTESILKLVSPSCYPTEFVLKVKVQDLLKFEVDINTLKRKVGL